MAGVGKQIIGSFEDIGKDIAAETVQVPKDVLGQALESLGTSSQKSQKSPAAPAPQKPSEGEKKIIPPREWLAELAGKNKRQPEPTVTQRFEKEQQEKNEKESKKAAVAQQMAPIVTGTSKPRRGNLYGIRQKSSSEISKNVRQD